jgi:hypothetical protein
MMPEPRSPVNRAFLPGVVLIAMVVLAALLLLLLWPVAPALRDALAAFIQARGDLIATSLLVIGLMRIVFAVGRRLDAQAEVAANQQAILVPAAAPLGKTQRVGQCLAQHGIIGFHHQTDTEVREACSNQHPFCHPDENRLTHAAIRAMISSP